MRNQKERDTKTQGYVPDPPRGHPPAGQDLPTTQRVWRVMTVATPTKKLHGLPPSAQLQGTASSIQRSPYMSLRDRKSTRLNSSHLGISYAVFCLKKKKDTTG